MYIDVSAIKLENSNEDTSDIHSFINSTIYSDVNMDEKPATRIASELYRLFSSGFKFLSNDMYVLKDQSLWKDTTIDHRVFKSSFTSYTNDKESRLDCILQYLMTRREASTIYYDNQSNEYKEAINALYSSVKSFNENHMVRSMFALLAKIEAFHLIKQNYEYFKTFATAGDTYTFKNSAWLGHLSEKGNLKYGKDIIDNFDYVASLQKLITDTFENNRHNLGDQTVKVSPEWILLGVAADKANCSNPIAPDDFESSDDLEGDLKSNTTWLEKLIACVKSLSVCQPDKYKVLFKMYTNNQNGVITSDAMAKNPFMVALLAHCSHIRIDERVLADVATNMKDTDANKSRSKMWTSTITKTEKWRGIRSVMDHLPMSTTLFGCIYEVSHRMRHQPDYSDVLARYATRIYAADSEIKAKNADLIEYMNTRLFNEDDLELAEDTLGMSTIDTFNMLYMKTYGAPITAQPLPELDISHV